MYILIVITYLGGSAWGPAVSMQEYTSQARCEAAKTVVLDTVTEMNKSNLAGGHSLREIITAKCVPK